jgi:DNA-binding CsgD family transcriptional regulator
MPPSPAAVKEAVARSSAAATDALSACQDAVAHLGEAVPFARWCGLLLDPATLLNTGGYHAEGLPFETLPRLVELEAAGTDVLAMPALMRDRAGVSTLHRATRGNADSSARYRDVLAPTGLGRELRAVLRERGRAWGALILFRETDAPDFSTTELRLLSSVGPTIARAVRRCLLLSEVTHRDAATGPGIVLLRRSGGELAVETASRAAHRWLADVPDGTLQGSGVPVVVASLAQRAFTAADRTSRIRLRARSGGWLTLHVDVLDSDEPGVDRLSLVIEPTRPHELAEVIAAAYALSDRERAVARLVVAGHTNRQIATALWLSPHTVSDHLKNVFAKLDVTNRAELTARLFFDHYLPRQSAQIPIGGDGWYIDQH